MHTFPSGLHGSPPSWLKTRIDLACSFELLKMHLCFVVCLFYPSMMMQCFCEINCWPPSPKGPVLSSAAMSAKAISEQTGKEFLYKYICTSAAVQNRFRYASVTAETDWDRLAQEHPWLLTEVRLDTNFYRLLACLCFRLLPQPGKGILKS